LGEVEICSWWGLEDEGVGGRSPRCQSDIATVIGFYDSVSLEVFE
jgi:hypothetical protein